MGQPRGTFEGPKRNAHSREAAPNGHCRWGLELFDARLFTVVVLYKKVATISGENRNAEMRIWWLHKALSVLLVYSFSLFSLAADQASAQTLGAVLHAAGRVEINGLPVPATKALLPGDLVETSDNSVANITTAGASIQVMPNSSEHSTALR